MTEPAHQQLAIPFEATANALVLPDDLSFDRWVALGHMLRRAVEGALWWLGDWWVYGEHHYGDRARAVAEGEIGWSYQTCKQAGVVARRFEQRCRRLNLSWSHHQEVSGRSDAEDLLDLAEDNRWSHKELRAFVNRRRTAERLGLATAMAPDLAAAGLYQVVYADPPWSFGDSLSDRAVENHYLTMDMDEIAALDVPAADDAVLFLWAPSSLLDDVLSTVIPAWGFEYCTAMVWTKDHFGMGAYVRQQHEPLLIAKRGDMPAPAPENRPSSVVYFPKGEHSAKPLVFYELIEQMYPRLAYIELFARQARPGWATWGNQVVTE